MGARVVRLSIAPVKALGLVHPAVIELGLDGVPGDRRFWLVDADGRLFNGKRDGPLVTIRPEWDEATRVLTLSFPDGTRATGEVELGEPVPIELYGQPHASRRVLGPWQEALSTFIGRPLTLLWSEPRATDRGRGGGTMSLVSQGSLARLGGEAGAGGPLDGRRFRMLLEVDGLDPHEEDTWIGSEVQVGAARVVINGDVGRCVVTSQDPDTGVTDVDTLAALAHYRPDGQAEPLPLGVFGAVVTPGRVAVGDPVVPAPP